MDSAFNLTRRRHLEIMLYARRLETQLAALYRQGRISGGVYLGRGQEAFSAAAGLQLKPGDIFAPLLRDCAGRIAFGEPLEEIFRAHLGKVTGLMRGRDGNAHRGHIRTGILPMISSLGSMIAPVNGVLLGRRLRGEDKNLAGQLAIGMASIGDGGMSTGALHEGLNAAAVLRLPLVLLVADNQYAYSTPSRGNYACRHLVERAAGYGIRGHRCDGNDANACLRVLNAAVEAARRGEGPQMVVASLLRLCGHGEHDDASYIPKSILDAAPDCVARTAAEQREEGLLDSVALAALEQRIQTDVQQALARVNEEPDPDTERMHWQALSRPEQLWQL